jgi:hypothetical protein
MIEKLIKGEEKIVFSGIELLLGIFSPPVIKKVDTAKIVYYFV